MVPRDVYVLYLRPEPNVDGIRALRRGLKLLLRLCGLRCVSITTKKEKNSARWPTGR